MMQKFNKGFLLLLTVLIQLSVAAQEFRWKSALDTVPYSGYFTIPLGLEWLAQLKEDFSDVRIRNEKGEEVPFIMKRQSSNVKSAFISFPILENKTDSVYTILELDTKTWDGGDHFCLVLGNTAVKRTASLSGSNDRKQWFVIDENIPLSNDFNTTEDYFVQWLNFPFIRYPYLKVTIRNKGSDALQILKAGIYSDTPNQEFLESFLQPLTTFRVKDSTDGNTYAWIQSDQPYPVARIEMKISAPRFYRRKVAVYKVNEKSKDLLAATEFNSGKDPVVWLIGEKARILLAVIENGDNPPLKIESIITLCRKQDLIAYLEKGKIYTLHGGSASAKHPEYDLEQFRDSIPPDLAVVDHGRVVANTGHLGAVRTSERSWLWPAIILMIVVLGLLTVKLVGDMKNKSL